jgi:phosphoribosyl-dephospho-CoA transferase
MIHDLLKVDAAKVILDDAQGNQSTPSWVAPKLQETPWVVVRRGVATPDWIPIGIRGAERSQRWAASCPPAAIHQIATPMDLLNCFNQTRQLVNSPLCNDLRSLAIDWQWFTHSSHLWGPGGSLGFELATGKQTTTSQSDLDIVIYANNYLPKTDAQRLLHATRHLNVPVDIRVETPVGGFSLTEYSESSGQSILLRTAAGPMLSDNPWKTEF